MRLCETAANSLTCLPTEQSNLDPYFVVGPQSIFQTWPILRTNCVLLNKLAPYALCVVGRFKATPSRYRANGNEMSGEC